MFWREYTLVNLQMVCFIHIGEEKKWYYTFASLEIGFLIHIGEGKKWCTLASLQMVLSMHARKGNK
jgi:hypothetical protein